MKSSRQSIFLFLGLLPGLGAAAAFAGFAAPARAQLPPDVWIPPTYLSPAARTMALTRGFSVVDDPLSVARLHTVFFPPSPPPLGGPVPLADIRESVCPAPAELAAYVGEPFYPQLGTRLAAASPDERLNEQLQQRLSAFRAARTGLQTEMQARLYTLREIDAPARLQSLEAFARDQAPRIAELDRAAEALRTDLLVQGGEWNAYRRWNLGAMSLPPERQQVFFFTVLRAAVFFGEGISPAQRRLLRETVIEMQDALCGAAPSAADGAWIFFSPDTARIRVPDSLPAEVAERFKAYAREKQALRDELRGALIQADKTFFIGGRAPELEALAGRQAPRIAALEARAEEIRRALKGIIRDPLRGPDLPSLPPALEERIAAYRREKLGLQKELLAKVESASGPRVPAGDAGRQDRAREAIAAFTQQNAARYAALEKTRAALRDELAHSAPAPAGDGNRSSSDRLLKNFADALQQLETWRLYRDYQAAVFEPGLSPEQRRLLFDGAIEKLALPLPGGERQPY